MDFGISGKTALVLGGGGGLGSAICLALAAEGAAVAVADLDLSTARATATAIAGLGGTALPLELDLAAPDGFDATLAGVESELGPVEVLVNNGGGPPPGPITEVGPELWRRHFDAMVLGIIELTGRVLPGMRERGWGRVITSTSSGVIAPIPNLGLSNALRSSLVGWSKTLAGEVGADGITVNVVLPGRVATGRIRQLDEAKAAREKTSVEEVARASAASIPLRRYGEPEEYGAVVAFLAGRPASYITGSVIRIDGGYIPSI